MRFNFITTYTDSVVPLFSSSPVSARSLLCSRGMLDSVSSTEAFSAFGPSVASFNSEDFAVFSKSFKVRNSYLSTYLSKKEDYFGDYSNLQIYSSGKNFFQKNIVLYKTIRNYRYNSLMLRAGGFRLGSLPFKAVSKFKSKLFKFFRGLSFYKLVGVLGLSVFSNRGQFFSPLLGFFSFLKTFFFKYFVISRNNRKNSRTFHVRSQSQKFKLLKRALIYFFFFRNYLLASPSLFNRGSIFLDNFSDFYLSEAIFFNSRLRFSRKTLKRFSPLAIS